MVKIRNILISAITFVAFSLNVSAGTYSLGVTGSILDIEASGTETDKLTAAGANVADTSVRKKTISKTTPVGSLFAEFTSASSYPVTIGFEYTPGTADISGGLSRTDTVKSITGTTSEVTLTEKRTASADATNFSTLYVEAPLFGAMYARAGLSHMDINYVTTSTGTNGGSYSDDISLSGVNLGIGFKGNTAGGMLWKATYEHTNYDDFTLNSTGNSVAANSNTIKGDADTIGYRFSLAKSF